MSSLPNPNPNGRTDKWWTLGQADAYFLAKKWNDLGADSGHSFGDLRLLVHFHVEAVGHFVVLEQTDKSTLTTEHWVPTD